MTDSGQRRGFSADGHRIAVLREGALLVVHDVLTVPDIKAITEFADRIRTSMPTHFEVRGFEGTEMGGNQVTYMNRVFQDELPDIHDRLVAAAGLGVETAAWAPPIGSRMGVRCIERLEYETGGHLGWHEDTDSIYTMIAFLSEPGVDFTGGELEVRISPTDVASHSGTLGSLLLVRSELSHAVTPVLSGRRVVLAMEFWRFQDARRNDRRPAVEYGAPFD